MLTTFVIIAAFLVVALCSVARARSQVNEANDQIERGWLDRAEQSLQSAEKILVGLTDAERDPIAKEILGIRAKLAAMPSPEDGRKISAAKGKVRQVQSQLDSGQPLGAEDNLKVAENFLEGLKDEHKAEVAAEINALREKVAAAMAAMNAPAKKPAVEAPPRASGAAPAASPSPTASPAASPTAVASPPPTPAAVQAAAPAAAAAISDEVAGKLSRAKSQIGSAKSYLELGRLENIAYTLEQAEKHLEGVPDEHKAAMVTQIQELRTGAAKAEQAENSRRIESEIERHIRSIESFLSYDARGASDSVARAEKRLNDDDTKQIVSPERLAELRAKLEENRAKLNEKNKAEVLDRAEDKLKQLEEQVAEDPYAGKDEYEAYKVHSTIESLRKGTLSWLADLPVEDADAAKLRARLGECDQKIAKASAAWGKAQVDASVGNDWSSIQRDIAGWEQETVPADARPLETPNLPKTATAIRRIGWWLDDPKTKETRAENKGDATLEATWAEAERTRAAAAEKLSKAFNDVLAAAEKMETPMRSFDLDRPNLLAVDAENLFAGTPHMQANIARARKLDDRWKAEVAAIMKQRQELYDKLAGEAESKWQDIVSALSPESSFDPGDASMKGKTVLLSGVYNRSGWDFARDYSFAMRINGLAVGGDYEPYILKALEHAWYELKLDVNDRIPWDVVGVVLSPGQIGRRVTVTLKDKDTNREIGKIEEHRPEPCVRLKIIALHAGPVAAAPQA